MCDTSAESSEDLWLKVADYLEAAYDTKVIRKVFISGDGHGWIREGLNWIDKSVFVLDRFHLAKYIRKATAHMEYTRESLWGYVERGMSRAVGDLLDILANEAERGHKQQEVREAKRYSSIIGKPFSGKRAENMWGAVQKGM